MLRHRTTYRVIYGDTDQMGVAYYANYLRWFEIARTEMFRFFGLPYRKLEEEGFFLPVSEAYCRYLAAPRYDDLILIDTEIDPGVKGGLKFDYVILSEDGGRRLAEGFTKHAFLDRTGRVVRPPKFFRDLIREKSSAQAEKEAGKAQ